MKTYPKIVSDSLNLITHLLSEIQEGLNTDSLTDELKDLLIVSKIKLGRMQRHHESYLNDKKGAPE